MTLVLAGRTSVGAFMYDDGLYADILGDFLCYFPFM